MAKKLKFIVVSPRNLRGGAIVLHELCRELVAQGNKASIFYIDTGYFKDEKKFWRDWKKYTFNDIKQQIKATLFINFEMRELYYGKSLGGCKRKLLPITDNNTIVIYPDVVYGNILGASKVVRWLLSNNRYKDQPGAYGDKDLFICFRDYFNDKDLNPAGRKLELSYYDLKLYRKYNFGNREGNCYIIRKGKRRKDLPKKFDGIIVDDLPEKEKVAVFNSCEYCICYDTQTSYSSIASICGCITVIVPEEGKKREDYRGADDFEEYGVAFGFEEKEINYAKETLDKAAIPLLTEMENGKQSVSNFIAICREYFDL